MKCLILCKENIRHVLILETRVIMIIFSHLSSETGSTNILTKIN